MPRVLQIINRLNLGGPTYIAGYLSAYMGDEFETQLVAGMKDDSEESSDFIIHNMGITPIYIKNMKREISIKNDRVAYFEIDAIIKKFKPDIVHTHAAKAGTLGRLAAWRNNVPVALHTFHGHVFHGYFSPAKTRIFLEIERFLASKTAGIIAISNEQKRELVQDYKVTTNEKAFVIPLGMDLSKFSTNMDLKRKQFREKYLLDDDTIAIGIIGRVVPIKNHQLFIDAFKLVLQKTSKKIHAFIIGDGEDMQKIKRYCTDNELVFNTSETNITNAHLTFTSWILEIDWAVSGMDIIALSSLNEGTPVSLMEAQAAGKSIVSTNVGGIKDIVIEGETALLSPSENVEKFAENLLLLTENNDLRSFMHHRGIKFAIEKFSYQRLITDTQNLYKQLLYANPARKH
jgi:glycosyltransferase involved in cell wall biosynthesis